jgi:hypothetical protein
MNSMVSLGVLRVVLAAVPLVAYAALVFTFYKRRPDLRRAVLDGAVVWALLLAATTEILSVPRFLTIQFTSIAWLIVTAVALWTVGLPCRNTEPNTSSTAATGRAWRSLDAGNKLLLTGVGVELALLAVTAVVCPPNTRDALSYHLPRVVSWVNNRSVAFYPTSYYWQLAMAPWTEYAMVHFFLPFGNDRLVDLVTWASFVETILGVSLIARELGADLRGQVIAAVAAAALPQGILMASGAKNDPAIACWLTAATFYLLRWRTDPSWLNGVLGAGSLGLATFTKGTAYLFYPALFIAAFVAWPALQRRLFLRRAMLLILLPLALNGAFLTRNMRLSGSPLGFATPDGPVADGTDPFRQAHLGVLPAAANIVRNVSLHLVTPSQSLNVWTERYAKTLIRMLRQDPDDPDSLKTENGQVFPFHINAFMRHEVFAGAPLQLLLFVISFVFLALRGKDQVPSLIGAGVIGAFSLYCALTRWQPFNARLHFPLFAIGCAVIGLAAARVLSLRGSTVLGLLLLVSGFPFALGNNLRPLLTGGSFRQLGRQDPAQTARAWYPTGSIVHRNRVELYFADGLEDRLPSWTAAAADATSAGCRSIGIDASQQPLHTYAMLALVGAGSSNSDIRYIGVSNRSNAYSGKPTFQPCAVVCLKCAGLKEKQDEYARHPGWNAASFGDVLVVTETAFTSRP